MSKLTKITLIKAKSRKVHAHIFTNRVELVLEIDETDNWDEEYALLNDIADTYLNDAEDTMLELEEKE